MRQAKKCIHCGHPIKKVSFMSQGQSMYEWRHTSGGRYCKVPKPFPECGNCGCNSPDDGEAK